MSVSFQIMKGRKRWRFEAEGKYDLTNWDVQYQPDRILCTPRPLEFIYMAFGAALFLGLAVAFLLFAINPKLMLGKSSRISPAAPVAATFFISFQQGKSKFQQEPPTEEDVRRATRDLMDNLLKDKTPEEREQFLKRIRDNQTQRNAGSNERQKSIDRWLSILSVAGRVLAVIPIALFSFIGGYLCLPRAILFFWNRVCISIGDGSLRISRPKLFGGAETVDIPLVELGSILTSGSLRRAGPRAGRYVSWLVQITSRNPDVSPVQFELEHSFRTIETEVAPSRVKRFAEKLSQLTGKPMGRRKKT